MFNLCFPHHWDLSFFHLQTEVIEIFSYVLLVFLSHFEFSPLPDLNWLGPCQLSWISILIFFKNLCVLFSCILEGFSSMLSTSLIWFSSCRVCPFLDPMGILFLCLHFYFGFLTSFFNVNESSFISESFSTCWFHFITYLFFLSLS